MASFLDATGITALIFGGCCSNVFALEAILESEAGSGLLITFLQFVFTAASTYLTQIDVDGRYGLRKTNVPLSRWAFIAVLFCTINVLNNWAFAFNISVPIHIILRSFGSVTTMIAGMIRGKRYSALQIVSVVILTLGVVVSAWADKADKGEAMDVESEVPSSEFTTGLLILLVAQVMSAFMGAFVEETYTTYKATSMESMFYTHLFGLPFFLPFSTKLRQQYERLEATEKMQLQSAASSNASAIGTLWKRPSLMQPTYEIVEHLPRGIFYLLVNVLTQLACISGVNALSARSSAVTVTIILNIRKLVSFLFSTFMFGHALSPMLIVGSALVFGSGALYGWETSWRIPRRKAREHSAKAKTG